MSYLSLTKDDLFHLASTLEQIKQATPTDPEGFEPNELDEGEAEDTKAITREYDSRGEGAGVHRSIHQILADYDKEGFVRWVEAHKRSHRLGTEEEFTDQERMLYESLLKQCAPELSQLMRVHNMPIPLCGSIIYDSLDIRIPTELLEKFPPEEVLDEYFGACYSEYHTKRFIGGMAALIETVKQDYPDIGQILSHRTNTTEVMFSVISPGEFDAVYGPNAVQIWVEKHGVPSWWSEADMPNWKYLIG